MRARRWTQAAGALAANPWFAYLGSRVIYQGSLKGVCFPGFNCYACPLALFSCPIGSLQYSLAANSPLKQASAAGHRLGGGLQAAAAGAWTSSVAALLYVAGFIVFLGALSGRLLCGWICPFGLLQDLLHKIPSPKFRLPGWARYGKYAALALLAMLIPYLTGVHWFSRLCPAGALEGAVPLKLLPPHAPLPPVGWFFWMKMAILAVFLGWMVVTSRPFCRAVCPLGAALAPFNSVSLYRMEVDPEACDKCMKCKAVCPVDIDISENPNSPECIRCLECKRRCPRGAVTSGFRLPVSRSGARSSPG